MKKTILGLAILVGSLNASADSIRCWANIESNSDLKPAAIMKEDKENPGSYSYSSGNKINDVLFLAEIKNGHAEFRILKRINKANTERDEFTFLSSLRVNVGMGPHFPRLDANMNLGDGDYGTASIDCTVLGDNE